MEYTTCAVAAFTVAASVAGLEGHLRSRAYRLGLAGFAALTVVADTALVSAGVFSFGHRFVTGLRIGAAPVEDVLYGGALYSVAVTVFAWRGEVLRRLREVLRVSRPFSWINTALPCLACGLAVGRPTPALALATIYFLGPYNLLLYGANDVFDYESDRRNPRKTGGVEGSLVPPGSRGLLYGAIALSNVPLVATLAWLGGPLPALVLVFTVGVALVYSVPPLRTKELPGLDALTSSLHFVLPSLCGGLLAGATLGEMPWRYLLAFVMWGAASQSLGAIQDVEFDREAGIGSIAVSLGPRPTAIVSLVLYSAAAAVVATGGGLAVLAALALLPYPLMALSCLAADSQVQARRAWKGFLGMNLLSGFLITQLFLQAWGVGRATGLEAMAWGSAAGLAALAMIFAVNRALMRRRRTARPVGRVSVVVPARDEEATLAACLESLPRDLEVIVVDDGSCDRTLAVAAKALGSRGRAMAAGARPAGWTGKCWAAWRGAMVASGDFLVFLDADTRLSRLALDLSVAEVAATGGLVSLLTRYEMPTPAERAVMPAFALMQLALWPQAFMPLAYGPCMAVRRSEYMMLGGHRAVAGSDREDLDLARLYARAGRRARMLHGADLGATRHYRSAAEAIAAWRRMYYAYAGHSLAVALCGIVGLAAVFLLPGPVLVAAWAVGDWHAVAGAGVGLVILVALRLGVALSERQPLATVAWHPVTWIVALWAMCLSVADGLRGRRPIWRGVELPEAVG